MNLMSFRKSQGLTQEQVAVALGLSATSKGYISALETGAQAPLHLALKIEEWSAGAILASSLVGEEDAELLASHARFASAKDLSVELVA